MLLLRTSRGVGDALALLLEDGSGFLTMETGDLLLLE